MTDSPTFDTITPPNPAGHTFDTGSHGDAPTHADTPTDSGRADAVGVAKDRAASVGQSAADAGQHVAGVAQDQAKNVVAEAGNQAKDLLGQARSELSEQAGAQQQRLATGLHALGDELHSMAQHSDQSGVATDLARQGASKSHDIASWLQEREPGHLVQQLQGFARQRPGAFLLAAAGAGLLAGRLTRGVKDAGSDDGDAASAAPSSALTEREAVPGPALAAPDEQVRVPIAESISSGPSDGAGL